MTTFQFQTHVSDSGVITLPTLAETFYGEDVTVKVDMDTPADNGGGACRISDLWGVGAEMWQSENVNEYIRKERDSWD
jgi:hypothetical protein